MPYLNILVHYVWSTKYREKILLKPIRKLLFAHIREYAQSKNIVLDRINGHLEHVHCMISLRSGQTVDNVINLIKGESCHWINNKSGIQMKRLQWQDDYFAVGVSESMADIVRAYIDNQEAHHKTKSFDAEYQEFMQKYKFQNV